MAETRGNAPASESHVMACVEAMAVGKTAAINPQGTANKVGRSSSVFPSALWEVVWQVVVCGGAVCV